MKRADPLHSLGALRLPPVAQVRQAHPEDRAIHKPVSVYDPQGVPSQC